jgi:hypothetical protein
MSPARAMWLSAPPPNLRFLGAFRVSRGLDDFFRNRTRGGLFCWRGPAKNDGIGRFIAKYSGKSYPRLEDKRVAKQWYQFYRDGLPHQ